jgi:hypothetical protein
METIYRGKGPAERIADRLKSSGGEGATHHVVHGTGPTRTHTHIHEYGHQGNHGKPAMGQRDAEYTGKQRG